MSVRITCPSCDFTTSVSDEKRGTKVRCKECDRLIPVPAAPGGKKNRGDDEAIQDSRKVAAKSTSGNKRSRDDDDEDDRPTRPTKAKAKSGFSVIALVGGGLAVLALLGVLCVGAPLGFILLRTAPAQVGEEQIAKVKLPDDGPINRPNPDPNNPNPNDPPNPPKNDPPIVDPNPGKPLPDALTAENVTRVKQATVYLRVTLPGGQIAEGSGFFALEPGIIITNAHVLGMLQSTSRPPNQVDVVLHSGEPEETKMVGQVLGVDRVCDLAVVRVPQNAKLPAPLQIGNEPMVETQKVFIFGFPFGEKLGKDITVSVSNISSFRRDPATRELKEIQMNGGMHPGNSGGPVVNANGNLVGVSVSVITGTQINFAVPGEKVRMIMEGRLAEARVGEPYQLANQKRIPIECQCLDPLNRVRELSVDVWIGDVGPGRAPSFQAPANLPGDGPRQRHKIAYADGKGKVDVPLPPLPGGKVYWLQPVLTTARGLNFGPAESTTPAPVFLERKPANLTANFTAQKERTSKLNSEFSMALSSGKKKTVIRETTRADLYEVVQDPKLSKGKPISEIKTAYGALSISISRDGKNVVIPNHKPAEAAVKTMPPTFVLDATNTTASYITVTLKEGSPIRDLVTEFNGMVANGYEATTFQLPNRLIQPMETFASKSTMMFRTNTPRPAGKPAIILDLILTCTYEGTRTRDGREEAIVTVMGNLQGRQDLKGRVDGNISGKFGVDLQGGFISMANIKIVTENEEQIPGLGSIQEISTQQINVERTAGNPMGLALRPEKGPPKTGTEKGVLVLSRPGSLLATDPLATDPLLRNINSRMKVVPINMEGGREYVISLNSQAFDSYLILESPNGQKVAQDDDGAGFPNARIVYRAAQSGLYRIVVGAFDGKTGPYQLTVHDISPGTPKKDDPIAKKDDPLPKVPDINPKGQFTRPAKSAAPTSYLKIVSTPGDYIGQGKAYDYPGPQLTIKKTPRGVRVTVDRWNLDVGGPKGQFFAVGEYLNAKRFAFSGDSPGLDFYGQGRGSNKVAGEFVVWELEMNGDQIVRLALDFVQRSDEKGQPLNGKLRFNSTLE